MSNEVIQGASQVETRCNCFVCCCLDDAALTLSCESVRGHHLVCCLALCYCSQRTLLRLDFFLQLLLQQHFCSCSSSRNKRISISILLQMNRTDQPLARDLWPLASYRMSLSLSRRKCRLVISLMPDGTESSWLWSRHSSTMDWYEPKNDSGSMASPSSLL